MRSLNRTSVLTRTKANTHFKLWLTRVFNTCVAEKSEEISSKGYVTVGILHYNQQTSKHILIRLAIINLTGSYKRCNRGNPKHSETTRRCKMDRYLHYKQLVRSAYLSRKTIGAQCASDDTFRNRRKRAGIASAIPSVITNRSQIGENYRAQPMLFPEHKSYSRE